MNSLIPKERGGKLSTIENQPRPAASSDPSIQQQRMTQEAKAEFLYEKTIELDELTRIKDLSAQIGLYFDHMGKNAQGLSKCTEDVAGVLGNWECTFGTMGLMNTESGNPTIVTFPLMSDTKND